MAVTLLTSNEVEAANRAEVTALLIRAGYRVYRPEADCYGEDLILRDREGTLHAVQLKSRPTVDPARYGGEATGERKWFLVPHDDLCNRLKEHGDSFRKDDTWSTAHISKSLSEFLKSFRL
jgi:hypothetical protein